MSARTTAALVVMVVLALAGAAHAYPQYQLSHEQTCASCHVAPSGGGLLAGMGELTAEDESMWGGDPSFLHGAIDLPGWLRAGGDVRGALGLHDRGDGAAFAGFPMQTEVYVHAARGPVSVYATAGAGFKDESIAPWFREHWVMWKPQEGGEGAYVRVGRLLPVFGLRLAEHPLYTRRYGGTPLYAEAYGVSAGWQSSRLEVHATGFVADRWVDGTEKGDGGALYVERRVGPYAFGAQARYAQSDDDARLHGGLIGKAWLESLGVLLQAEAQVIRQSFEVDGAPSRDQLVGQLVATWFVRAGVFADLGVGHYDEDLAVADVDRDAVDVNVHWFPTSHFELILSSRVQLIGFGAGGPGSGYSLLQLHYRL